MLDILLVDDEPSLVELVAAALRKHGHHVAIAPSGASALEAATHHPFDAMVCDVHLPEVDGLTVLKRMRQSCPDTAVILMTAHGGVKEAVSAISDGALDYLTKPFQMADLLSRLQRIAPHAPHAPLAETPALPAELLGTSAAMVRLRDRIDKFANAEAPVLIQGESGTGKELVSRALHLKSARRHRPFVAVNCASCPDTLLEAELFGHERGAFTGAVRKREGRFQAADGGTLLLDEVAELPTMSQPKLLRVLQEQTFEPLGTNHTVRVDVRVLSATHRSLKEQLAQGKFREDLYYRLKILELDVPALRERHGDVPLLVEHFVRRFATPNAPTTLSEGASRALAGYTFPGNVRELEHAIRHAMVLAVGSDEVMLEHLPPDIAGATPGKEPSGQLMPLHDAVAQYERGYLMRALAINHGAKAETAAQLGISRKNLWEKLRRYAIE
jgi:DNA-binding NtrC family response regulator